jgi:hypothetical protein
VTPVTVVVKVILLLLLLLLLLLIVIQCRIKDAQVIFRKSASNGLVTRSMIERTSGTI